MGDRSEAAHSWVSDVSNDEVIGFVVWVAVEFALALTATLAIVHRAVALPAGGHLGTGFLIG